MEDMQCAEICSWIKIRKKEGMKRCNRQFK